MNITIRQLKGEEMLETLYTLNSYSLYASPPLQNKEEWIVAVRARQGIICQAVFEDEMPVSVVVSTPMTQNVRGKLYPASGVWGVSTAPAARRKGYCRQAMASLLSVDRDSGNVFSNLYPFRESFYERLGYVAFPLVKIVRLRAQSLLPLLKHKLDGEIKLQPIGEAFDTYREYLAEMCQHTHGMAFFDFGDRANANRNVFWAALADFDGKIEGLMLYRTLGEEVTKYDFSAIRFYYKTSRARYLLLSWIARHIDQVDRVEIWLPPHEYPETWLADTQVKVETAVRPAMGRVLDVGKMDGMDVGKDSFSARIVDPLCPWNEGLWRFESNQGKLHVSPTTRADCELTIQGLTALIIGPYEPQDILFHSWGNPDPAIQSILLDMFPRMSPFMHEIF